MVSGDLWCPRVAQALPLGHHGCALSTSIRIIEDPAPAEVGDSAEAFLDWLGGPAEIRLTGRDRARRRVAVGLIHGNEPSGLHGIHRWLRAGRRPAVDASLFVLAVDAARLPPGFAFRMPPGRRDLNRCCAGPWDDEDGALAAELLARVRRRPCEALVDLHNNTGHNPPYGVVTRVDGARMRLVSLFSGLSCVLGELRLGTLTEAIESEMPAVSIECGQAGDPAADDVAAAGLRRFLDSDDLELDTPLPSSGDPQPAELPMELFDSPVRVCLRPGIEVAFAGAPMDGVDLTLVEHIERHNFRALAPGTLLGWVAPEAPWPLEARDNRGRELSRGYFAVDGGALRWIGLGDLVPIMMTTDARVARSDCLCYLVFKTSWPA